MRKLIWLAILLPFYASAQVNGTIQKTAATGVVRGNFGAGGLDTLVKSSGNLTQTVSGSKTMTGGLKARTLSAPGVVTITDAGAGSLSAGTYKVGVVAVSAEGGEGAFDYAGYYLLGSITISASHNISVSWGSVPNAVAYRVYISDSGGSYYVRYFQTTNTNLTISTQPVGLFNAPVITPSNSGGSLKKGNYYFAVSATFSDGGTNGQTYGELFPVAQITTDAGSVGMTWNSVSGATGYRVYVGSETDAVGFRVLTKYFNSATNSATVTGGETYITGLDALTTKGYIGSESTALTFTSAINQYGNNKSFLSADLQIAGYKGANSDLILKRYDKLEYAPGAYSGALVEYGTGINTIWQVGIGGITDNYQIYNNSIAAPAFKIDETNNKATFLQDLSLGTNSLLMTGSLGATGARLTKGWFTDLQVTNAISGSITGNAATATALATARTIGTITGDATSAGSSFDGTANNTNALTVTKVNGVAFSGLATGILKNTTSTGVPSIAIAADFPTLNQNTSGSAATLATPRTIGGVSFNGSANITVASATGGFAVSGGDITSTGDVVMNNASVLRGIPSGGGGGIRLISLESDNLIHIAQNNTPVVFGSGVTTMNNLTASQLVVTDGSKNLVSGGAAPTSGTYTPTATISGTTTSATAALTHYSRVGNEVTIAGSFTVSSTVGYAYIDISLPSGLTSNFTVVEDAAGSGTVLDPSPISVSVQANVATDALGLVFYSAGTPGRTCTFTAIYTIK